MKDSSENSVSSTSASCSSSLRYLRRRIIESIQENEKSQLEIAEMFSVSLSFIEKLWRRFFVIESSEK